MLLVSVWSELIHFHWNFITNIFQRTQIFQLSHWFSNCLKIGVFFLPQLICEKNIKNWILLPLVLEDDTAYGVDHWWFLLLSQWETETSTETKSAPNTKPQFFRIKGKKVRNCRVIFFYHSSVQWCLWWKKKQKQKTKSDEPEHLQRPVMLPMFPLSLRCHFLTPFCFSLVNTDVLWRHLCRFNIQVELGALYLKNATQRLLRLLLLTHTDKWSQTSAFHLSFIQIFLLHFHHPVLCGGVHNFSPVLHIETGINIRIII